MPASAHFYCAEYKYRLLEVQHWWFINNGPRETFSMLEMRSIILAPVALCDDVLLSVAIFCVGCKAFAKVGWIFNILKLLTP